MPESWIRVGSVLLGCAIGVVGSILGMTAFVFLSRRKKAAQLRSIRHLEEGRREKIHTPPVVWTFNKTQSMHTHTVPAIPTTTPTRLSTLPPPFRPKPEPPRRKPVPARTAPPQEPPKPRSLARSIKASFERLAPPSPLPRESSWFARHSSSHSYALNSKAEFGTDMALPQIETMIDHTPLKLEEQERREGFATVGDSSGDEDTVLPSLKTGSTDLKSLAEIAALFSEPMPLPAAAYIPPSMEGKQARYTIDRGYL